MPRNPQQLFVTNTVTRQQIAEDLNDQLLGGVEFHIYDDAYVVETLQPDDDRLTDEVCQQVANWLGEHDYAECDGDDDYAEFLHDILVKLGRCQETGMHAIAIDILTMGDSSHCANREHSIPYHAGQDWPALLKQYVDHKKIVDREATGRLQSLDIEAVTQFAIVDDKTMRVIDLIWDSVQSENPDAAFYRANWMSKTFAVKLSEKLILEHKDQR
jgi:hypothetical protein